MALLVTTACSTTAHFRLPPETTLKVTDRTAQPDGDGEWSTTPFFWSEAGGIHYQLVDKNGTVVRSGTLNSQFRVASLFWPPAGIIYWPMGFGDGEFDLTKPGDGYLVRDDANSPGTGDDPNAAFHRPTPAQADPEPSSGLGLIIPGWILIGIGALNLGSVPLCSYSFATDKDVCVARGLVAGGITAGVGIPLAIIGYSKRSKHKAWARRNAGMQALLGTQIAARQDAAFLSYSASF
jgi:hypothetical protein